ncbi:nibrin-like [Anopheles bellator]|uniref:nibrin-like n=1 Tax=Anopheles bellator TaxID=139047 RepID=UPI002647667C|nr:nibrin-like [Anopheles bellator]
MWYLRSLKTGCVYYLVNSNKHIVGRTNADLVINDDKSISRIHAVLQPDRDGLKVTDSNSRYGTYVNGNIDPKARIPTEAATVVSTGDTVQFGLVGSAWEVGRADFCCLTSTFQMTTEFANVLKRIGIEVVSSFSSDATHLIMPTITVTTKLLQCLVGQVPIVTPDYFTAVEQSIDEKKELPNAIDYKPECAEAYIRTVPRLVVPNPARRQLFGGKQFIFLSGTLFTQYDDIIKLAGGLCCCAVRERIVKSRFLKPEVITIKGKQGNESQSQSFDQIACYLSANGRRMVPDSEIGLAILYASTEKFCNPDYSFASNVEVGQPFGPAVSVTQVLANGTEEPTAASNVQAGNAVIHTIPETQPANGYIESMHYTGPPVSLPSSCTTSEPEEPAPVTRRLSKRLADSEKAAEKQTADDAASVSPKSKRPRKNCDADVSESSAKLKSTKINDRHEHVAAATANEVTIPETPLSQMPPSRSSSLHLATSGFLAVNRQPEKAPKVAHKRPNLELDDDPDALFNFGEVGQRKNQRTRTSLASASQVPSHNNNRLVGARSNNAAPSNSDLFAFNGQELSTQRTSKRQLGSTTAVSVANSLTNPSSINGIDWLKLPPGNDPSFFRYQKHIKPLSLSTSAWLAKVDPDECSLKIKQEEYDASSYTGKWLDDIRDVTCVNEVSMKLVPHRPPETGCGERSYIAPNGGKNFKAFVKNKNYLSQRTTPVAPLRCVCSSENCD